MYGIEGYYKGIEIILQQRLAVHAAEQPARKPNPRQHGSKPTVVSNN